ncbi:uncharacterized protein [Drosophila pseudoobscura]|uniref:Uncharacterized protein n=1 Tax=Drosophila pseudoobscura pseudoobscura TaxID=46245 RepID=A0A6I8VWY8_DROPS|nr:uncharacterized protein LOC26534150 [Drosophila pseudoobscura]
MTRSPLVQPQQIDTSGGQEYHLPADTDMPIIVYHGISILILKSGLSATSGTYTAESNVGLRDAPTYVPYALPQTESYAVSPLQTESYQSIPARNTRIPAGQRRRDRGQVTAENPLQDPHITGHRHLST